MAEPGGRLPAYAYAALGIEFATISVVSVVVGYHLDRRFGTEPFLMLTLSVGGFTAAVKRLLWSLKKHSSRGTPQ